MTDVRIDPQACLPRPPSEAESAGTGIAADSETSESAEAVTNSERAEDPPFFAWTEERYFDLYLAQRKGFSDSRKESFLRFDQTIITLAVGAVAVSVAFLEKQAVPQNALQVLFGSWATCIAAVLAILVSLLMSSKADAAQIRSLDECMRTGKPDQSDAKKWNSWVYGFNALGIVFCVLGITGLVRFGVMTLERKGESLMATDKKVPSKPQEKPTPDRREIREDRFGNQTVPLTKIDRAAPAEDLAGPFNKDKKR
jgi:hypothetical protein